MPDKKPDRCAECKTERRITPIYHPLYPDDTILLIGTIPIELAPDEYIEEFRDGVKKLGAPPTRPQFDLYEVIRSLLISGLAAFIIDLLNPLAVTPIYKVLPAYSITPMFFILFALFMSITLFGSFLNTKYRRMRNYRTKYEKWLKTLFCHRCRHFNQQWVPSSEVGSWEDAAMRRI